jgi:branched-chain amino acid transport system substrate-binding protein
VSVLATSALAGAVAACGGDDGGGSASSGGGGDPYKIGYIGDLSGNFAAYGKTILAGNKAFFDWTNAHGGVNGRKVELKALDGVAQVDRGIAAATQLMTQDHVLGITGIVSSGVCAGIAPLAEQNKTPLMCTAVGADLVKPVHPYLFPARPVPESQAAPAVKYAEQLLKDKPHARVATIIHQSAANVTYLAEVEKLAKQDGMQVVASEQVPFEAKEIGGAIAKVIAAKPDVVISGLLDPLALSFDRGLRNHGVDVPIVNSDQTADIKSLESTKDPNWYLLRAFNYVTDGVSGDVIDTMEQAAKAENADPNGVQFAYGYQEARVYVAALQKCGPDCDSEKLQKAMEGISLPTGGFAAGDVSYSAQDHQPMKKMNVFRWDDSKQAVVQVAAGVDTGF